MPPNRRPLRSSNSPRSRTTLRQGSTGRGSTTSCSERHAVLLSGEHARAAFATRCRCARCRRDARTIQANAIAFAIGALFALGERGPRRKHPRANDGCADGRCPNLRRHGVRHRVRESTTREAASRVGKPSLAGSPDRPEAQPAALTSEHCRSPSQRGSGRARRDPPAAEHLDDAPSRRLGEEP